VTGVVTVAVSVIAGTIMLVVNKVGDRIVAPPSSPASSATGAGTLVVNSMWPPNVDLSCDKFVNVAGLPGTELPDSLPAPRQGEVGVGPDPRNVAVDSIGAVTWYRGKLVVALSTSNDVPAYVLRIQPVVFERSDVTPAWGLEVQPPCGGPVMYRQFTVGLDRASIEDGGVIGKEFAESYGVELPDQPLGRTFTVSQSDPAELVFEVFACDGRFAWGLKIDYTTAGSNRTAWVGSAEAPLVAVGGWQGVKRFHVDYFSGAPKFVAGGQPPMPGQPAPVGPPASAGERCAA
jgi:hypothetical protein